jgi:putative addiction module killer protein
MVEVRKTVDFVVWLDRLADVRARAKVLVRIDRLAHGNAGDVRSLSAGLSEMRIDYGPGYRVYFTWRGQELVILLLGGNKQTQAADIRRAKALLEGLE